MATAVEWARAFARQAAADYRTFELMQDGPFPNCHTLQFLQMACEKLVKAHLLLQGSDPADIQKSHGYIAKNLPIVIRERATSLNLGGKRRGEIVRYGRLLAQEIETLTPAVKRGGRRPENCEYPWEDDGGVLHVPLDWSFTPSDLIVRPSGRTILKLVRSAIDSLRQIV